MNISDLIFLIKGECSNDLKPLPDSHGDEMYQLFPLTKKEFSEEYPDFPIKEIFVSCAQGIPSAVYWNSKDMLYLPLPIYAGKFLPIGTFKTAHDVAIGLKKEIRRLRSQRKAKEYIAFLIRMPDAMRIECLSRLLEEEEPSEELCEAALDIYRCSDYGFGTLNTDRMAYLLKNYMPAGYKREMKARLKKLPSVITIYRGEGEKSTETDKAMSWTTDPDVAHFYATRLSNGNPDKCRVIQAKCKKEDVLFCEEDDSDCELMVFGNVFDVHIKEQP